MKLKIWHLLNKTTAVAFGVLLVVFMFATPETWETAQVSSDSTEQSQDEDTSNDLLISIDWVSSFSTTHVAPVLNWIRDIDLPENPLTHIYEVLETGTTPFFQTLFERIISPNAP